MKRGEHMELAVLNQYFEGFVLDWRAIIVHRYFHAIFLVFAFFILRKFVVTRIFRFISNRLKLRVDSNKQNIRAEVFQRIFDSMAYSVRNIFFIIGLNVAVYIAKFDVRIEQVAINLLKSFMIFFVGYGIYKTLDALRKDRERLYLLLNARFDKILIDFVIKTLNVFVAAITILFILQEWGFNVSAFITGLGLSGLVLALAAKDMVSNIFAGFVVITDKPYSIGDWIETPSAEGTVEEITFRSTRIRTFANALVTVPNAKLIDNVITNWSRMRKRRISFNLQVKYETTVEGLINVRKRIEEMLRNHPEVDQDVIFVRFNEFSANSLDIFIYYFTRSTIWGEYLRVREDTLMKIIDILNEEKVEFAIPAQSIYIENIPSEQEAKIDNSNSQAMEGFKK
jgi:MscS family membrane protein